MTHDSFLKLWLILEFSLEHSQKKALKILAISQCAFINSFISKKTQAVMFYH